MTTFIRCYCCRNLFEKRLGECPECETPVRQVNVALASQAWRTSLNRQAAHAVKHT